MWQQWINLILGAWIILSTYANFTSISPVTNFTVTGALIVLFALWGALSHNATHMRMTDRRTEDRMERSHA